MRNNLNLVDEYGSTSSAFHQQDDVGLLSACFRLRGHKVPQGQIIDDVLYILHLVLKAVAPPTETVVLEIENLEACKEILDELVDEKGAFIISKGNRVASQA